MAIKNIVPVIAIRDLAKAKDFYTRVFGFEIVHENQWYVHLRAEGDQQLEIGFVASNHPSQPSIFQPAFEGKGVFYSMEVADVDAEYRRLKELGVPIKLEMMDEPWGERHFAVADPHGIILNINKTKAEDRGKVSYRDHMLQKEKSVHA